MAEQIEPSPLKPWVAVVVFTAVSVAVAELTSAALMLITKRWILPAWEGPGSPQSPIAVDADPGGQLAEQLDERAMVPEPMAGPLADQLGDQTAALGVDGLEASADV